MQVNEIMAREPITVAADASLRSALALMEESGIRHLPVVGAESLVGVLSDRDLLGEVGWLLTRGTDEPRLAAAQVGDVMQGAPITVGPDEDLARAAELMASERIGCLPVCHGAALVGLVTETDLLEAFVGSARYGRMSASEDPPVREVMTPDPVSVPFEASLGEAMGAMQKGDFRHLLVLDGERLTGMLSERDLRRSAGPQSIEVRCAGNVATREVRVVAPEEKLSTAALRMSCERLGALAVQSGKQRPVGILSVTDVLAHWARLPA